MMGEKQKQKIVYEDVEYEIGEFNVLTSPGGVKVSAADEYTLLSPDSSFLKFIGGPVRVRKGDGFRWPVPETDDAVAYEYTVISGFLAEVNGWLMHRADEMERTEPRIWSPTGEEMVPATALLDQIAAENAKQASEAAAAGDQSWQRSARHADAAGVAYPRVHRMAVADNQMLLTFRSPVEAQVFWKWVDEHGWDMFGSRDELL